MLYMYIGFLLLTDTPTPNVSSSAGTSEMIEGIVG